jgi:hypothetical protein
MQDRLISSRRSDARVPSLQEAVYLSGELARRTGIARALPDCNHVTTWFEVGASSAAESLRVQAA